MAIVSTKFVSIIKDGINGIRPKRRINEPISIDRFFQSGFAKIKQPLTEDAFTRTNRGFKIESVALDNMEEYRDQLAKIGQSHKARMVKYGNTSTIKPRKVSKEEFEAMNLIQYELDGYTTVQTKLRTNQPLTKKEEEFCEKVLKGTRPTEEDRTVWRMVGPYEGFEEAINSGEYDLTGFISTNSTYDDFFEFWGGPKIKKINGKRYAQKPYMLKINLPKGTPILDCNATCNGKRTRMNSEVVLLPGRCKVGKIDNEHDVIELFYQN